MMRSLTSGVIKSVLIRRLVVCNAEQGQRLDIQQQGYDDVCLRIGGGHGSRTRDPYVANVVLSQLS